MNLSIKGLEQFEFAVNAGTDFRIKLSLTDLFLTFGKNQTSLIFLRWSLPKFLRDPDYEDRDKRQEREECRDKQIVNRITEAFCKYYPKSNAMKLGLFFRHVMAGTTLDGFFGHEEECHGANSTPRKIGRSRRPVKTDLSLKEVPK